MSEEILKISENPFMQSIKYYKDASYVYRRNFWNFALTGFIGAVLINSLYFLFRIVIEDLPYITLFDILIVFLLEWPILMITNGFYGAILGMGYDIMGSGDDFTQFKHIFYYIRKYWFKYFMLGFVINFFVFLVRFIDPYLESFWLSILVYFLQMIIYMFFYIFNPAIIYYPKLSNAFKNATQIFQHYPKLITTSYIIYYIIFFVPILVINLLANFTFRGDFQFSTFYYNFTTIFWFWRMIVGYPFLALVSSRIINEYQYENSQI